MAADSNELQLCFGSRASQRQAVVVSPAISLAISPAVDHEARKAFNLARCLRRSKQRDSETVLAGVAAIGSNLTVRGHGYFRPLRATAGTSSTTPSTTWASTIGLDLSTSAT